MGHSFEDPLRMDQASPDPPFTLRGPHGQVRVLQPDTGSGSQKMQVASRCVFAAWALDGAPPTPLTQAQPLRASEATFSLLLVSLPALFSFHESGPAGGLGYRLLKT